MIREIAALLSPDQLFELHPKIRWAACSSDGHVLFSQMRSGIASYTDLADDRTFMELGPLFMTGLAERLTSSGKAGDVISVVVNMGYDSVLLMKVKDGHIAISADRADAPEVFAKVTPIIKERFC